MPQGELHQDFLTILLPNLRSSIHPEVLRNVIFLSFKSSATVLSETSTLMSEVALHYSRVALLADLVAIFSSQALLLMHNFLVDAVILHNTM